MAVRHKHTLSAVFSSSSDQAPETIPTSTVLAHGFLHKPCANVGVIVNTAIQHMSQCNAVRQTLPAGTLSIQSSLSICFTKTEGTL